MNRRRDLLAHLPEFGELVIDYRLRHADGAYRWMRDRVRLSRAADGRPLEIVGSMINITAEKQAEETRQSLLDKSAHGITIFQDNRIVYINPSITEQLGYTLEDLNTLSTDQLMQLVPEKERLLIVQGLQARRVEEAITSHYEIHLLDKRGAPRFLDLVTVPIVFRGRPALQTTIIDLTERERMEAALRESEEIQRVILDASPSSLMLLDSTGVILAANRTAAHRFGKRLEEIIGQNVGMYLPEEVARFRRTQLDIILQTRQAVRFEDNRAGMWFDTHAYPILSGDGQVRSVIVSAVDITERKQMEQSLAEANSQLEARVEERTRELAESREQLRKLTAGVVHAQEEERRRVSRELHDEAGQALVSMKFGLEAIQSELPAGNASLKGRLASAIRQVDQTMKQVRQISKSLHPALLDIADLNLALKDTCQEFGESTGLQVYYRGIPVPDLPKEAGLSFFRFLQEALTNVAKHAHATRVQVRLAHHEGNLSLSVEDNGIGAGKYYAEGLGHLGMHERFGVLQGTVEIRPHGRSGFFIAASIPWQADAHNDLAQAGGAVEDY
jgi:PAS domain S-box-containing protein